MTNSWLPLSCTLTLFCNQSPVNSKLTPNSVQVFYLYCTCTYLSWWKRKGNYSSPRNKHGYIQAKKFVRPYLKSGQSKLTLFWHVAYQVLDLILYSAQPDKKVNSNLMRRGLV
jgi:hypothetical protein